MTKLLSFSSLGTAHDAPRFWIEGRRLETLGFAAGTPIEVQLEPRGLIITPAVLSDRMVSLRRSAGGSRPIIDVNSHRLLGHLAEYREVKVTGSGGRLSITPSLRAFNIVRSLSAPRPFRVLDLFCGGGTCSDAFDANPNFRVVGGVEIEPDFADEFTAKHPEAELILGDFRRMLAEELPEFDMLVAGIPCVEHSMQGRAKKGLAGRPELGELGDLYVHVLALVAARMPLAVAIENVPSFGTSLAGMTMVANLKRLGYAVVENMLEPNTAWNEPTTRNRWVCIATLKPGFRLTIPNTPFTGRVGDFFDAPDAVRDQADVARIATTIEGLRRHNERHAAQGHGFAMKVLTGDETAAPTLCKSYHKCNSSGFFVESGRGPRMLRRDEIARLQGQTILTEHYATAVQMMGQGVLTRVFREIFRQLGDFLGGDGSNLKPAEARF